MTTDAKARRLYDDGHVTSVGGVRYTDAGEPYRTFHVEGDTATHTVTFDTYGLRCTCPARVRCSHEKAVELWLLERLGMILSANIVDPIGRSEP